VDVVFPSVDDFLLGKKKICVLGLGYVGIHVAVNFAKYFKVIGYDRNQKRIQELNSGFDSTREFSEKELSEVKNNLEFTSSPGRISECNLVIAAVPTPVNKNKIPDLSFLISASEDIGGNLSRGTYVVFESTVFPGATEEICVPILEKESGLKCGVDFKVGYSPERVNPGDKDHTFDKVVKVVAGQDNQTAEFLAKMYSFPVKAGVYIAPDIKTAEAAKVIENIQRDLNIALFNELSIIFHIMGIDTQEVIKAASTKWNFIKFEPGLVGGHCISVDPYYLTFKAEELGYHPQVILAGRRINDYMGKYVAENTIKLLINAGKQVKGSRALIMGITFKENISDIRESKVVDIYKELCDYGVNVEVYDPYADPDHVKSEFGIELMNKNSFGQKDSVIDFLQKNSLQKFDVVIVAVKHKPFFEITPDFFKKIMTHPPVLVDVKGIYSKSVFEREGFIYWRL
jgi:UDP-N-acetyl-D-galactosamine dehydrogenase